MRYKGFRFFDQLAAEFRSMTPAKEVRLFYRFEG